MKNLLAKPWQQIVKYFLAGVLAILPLVITVLVVIGVINFLNGLVGPEEFLGQLLGRVGLNFVDNPTVAYIVGWVLVLAVIFLLGVLVEKGLRSMFGRITEAVFRRVPLVGKVYDAAKQVVDLVDKQGDDKMKGMSVVYCSFGSQHGAGVLALLPTGETIPIDGKDHHIILVPQSPVPIGGGLLLVPVESVKPVDMSVDKFMSIYVSMGVTLPELMKGDSLPETGG